MKKSKKEKKKDKAKFDISSLPSPENLVQKERTTKVTLALSDHSIAFFKKQAKKQGIPYQKLLRSLVDHYVESVE